MALNFLSLGPLFSTPIPELYKKKRMAVGQQSIACPTTHAPVWLPR